MQRYLKRVFLALLVLGGAALPLVQAQEAAATGVVFEMGEASARMIADPGKNFVVIMKGGKVYKNSLQ